MTIEQLSYLNEITADNQVSYPDRHQMAVDRNVVLNLYVPMTSRFSVLPGSAIVGLPTIDGSRVVVYFEGDKYGTGMNFAEKVRHAAGRMVTRYPTVATASPPASDLHRVGSYDVRSHGITVDEWAALDAWRKRSE